MQIVMLLRNQKREQEPRKSSVLEIAQNFVGFFFGVEINTAEDCVQMSVTGQEMKKEIFCKCKALTVETPSKKMLNVSFKKKKLSL